MASLQELRGLFNDSDLQERTEAALVIAVQNVLDASPLADDQKYAAHVFANPGIEARKALMSVLAKNRSASVAAIRGATDNALQTNVDSVVATLSVAYNASIA